jgi:hypothetical protein
MRADLEKEPLMRGILRTEGGSEISQARNPDTATSPEPSGPDGSFSATHSLCEDESISIAASTGEAPVICEQLIEMLALKAQVDQLHLLTTELTQMIGKQRDALTLRWLAALPIDCSRN